jgi:hypothetical protein
LKACWWVKGSLIVQVLALMWLHAQIRAIFYPKFENENSDEMLFMFLLFFIYWYFNLGKFGPCHVFFHYSSSRRNYHVENK